MRILQIEAHPISRVRHGLSLLLSRVYAVDFFDVLYSIRVGEEHGHEDRS